MAIYNFTTEHLTVPDTQSTVISIVQEVRNEVSLIPDVIKPVIQGIFCAVGGALFTYAYGFFTQQKSYKDGYIDGRIDGYNKGYSEGFNTGYNKEIAFIAGAACVGAAVGAAAAIYYTQCRQQNTQIANAQTNQVTSNNLALVE